MFVDAPMIISSTVEGIVDEAVVIRLISAVGGIPGPVYGKKGKAHVLSKIEGYNNAAHHRPWLVLVDLDHEFECAPLFCDHWLPKRAQQMCFRVAVREVEAWLLADQVGIARFLKVAQTNVPHNPDGLSDPKRAMINMARHSRSRVICEDMVPREGSGRLVGPAYTSRLMEFIGGAWSPEEAMNVSDSLHRCVKCLKKTVERAA